MVDDEERQHMLDYEDEPNIESARPFSSRTQHGLTRSEMIQGMANRLMYSNFYIALYLGLGLLSLVSIILSIQETCPSLMFIIFEAIINFAMIIEVTIRLLALRRTYWQSVWNIIDIVLVLLCAITLIVLATGCSASERNEAIFDTVLLVIRNCFQFFRLFMMAKKNQYSIHARTTRIDFNHLPDDRNASLEFTRDQRLEQSFLDDDSDFEQDRI
ncbi:uncharacterized protein BX664DRAFT_319752 [Halteromyces radiatus]|uniref:uncharacterized protein n=1 Tax=Halteromyces radiatus TaxID=101107 RepID=UPI00221F5BE3|nr:uncharacterized protein BX664DRAFT_319752 [Halteromyces radiatus]KAI8098850.1 hypothetical protein BX664DRAFT_319752 [Halteromyces radiatus]